MHTDMYTKTLLSVIALCLLWMCVTGVTPTASAQADVQKVVVVGWDRPLSAVLVDRTGSPLINGQGLRVNLGGQTVPVAITAIEQPATWLPIRVEVTKDPGGTYPGR